MRGGVATGPAVAGVIGERKFAYDVWGDTVNLASRLEEHAAPGQVLVSEPTATAVEDRFEFGPVRILDVKGKGRHRSAPSSVPTETSGDGETSLDAEPP